MLRYRLRPEQTKWPAPRPAGALADFVLLLSPYAPHIAEELWARLGHDGSLAYVPWPAVDESLLVQSTVQLPVQVGHKFPFAVIRMRRSCSLRSCVCSWVVAACAHTCCESNQFGAADAARLQLLSA
jgi:leucyl-tRNA synthetase